LIELFQCVFVVVTILIAVLVCIGNLLSPLVIYPRQLGLAEGALQDPICRAILKEIERLIDAVYLKVAAVLWLHKPSGQWPGQRYVGAGTSDEPSDLPFPGDVAQCFRIRGTEVSGPV
jgi:hypothetical protein